MKTRITEGEIRAAVLAIARRIDAGYAERRPVLVGLLKGAYMFLADLSRTLTLEHDIDFVRARSYGDGTVSSGSVQIDLDVTIDVQDRDVVLVDDILDTGLTLAAVVEHLTEQGARSVRTCALVLRRGSSPPDYMGIETGPGFLVGYGLDHAEGHRGLPDIRVVDEG